MLDQLGDVGQALHRAQGRVWLVDVSERKTNPRAADLLLCVRGMEDASNSADQRPVDVSEGGLEPPRPLKGTSTSS